ncbi:hypothetical protein D1872_336390 [compost metagenome]
MLIVSLLWIYWIVGMRNPGVRKNLFLPMDKYDRERVPMLKTTKGVSDFYINETEETIVVKYDDEEIGEDDLRQMLLK